MDPSNSSGPANTPFFFVSCVCSHFDESVDKVPEHQRVDRIEAALRTAKDDAHGKQQVVEFCRISVLKFCKVRGKKAVFPAANQQTLLFSASASEQTKELATLKIEIDGSASFFSSSLFFSCSSDSDDCSGASNSSLRGGITESTKENEPAQRIPPVLLPVDRVFRHSEQTTDGKFEKGWDDRNYAIESSCSFHSLISSLRSSG